MCLFILGDCCGVRGVCAWRDRGGSGQGKRRPLRAYLHLSSLSISVSLTPGPSSPSCSMSFSNKPLVSGPHPHLSSPRQFSQSSLPFSRPPAALLIIAPVSFPTCPFSSFSLFLLHFVFRISIKLFRKPLFLLLPFLFSLSSSCPPSQHLPFFLLSCSLRPIPSPNTSPSFSSSPSFYFLLTR